MTDDKRSAWCTWSQDSDGDDWWSAGCGNAFVFTFGGPSENGMRYCCYCGRPLVPVLHGDEENEEPPA